MPVSQWRTVGTVAYLAIVMLVALYLCRGAGDLGGKLFSDAIFCILGLGGVQGLKSGLQHLASGSGLSGVLAALTKSAKPAPPTEPPK